MSWQSLDYDDVFTSEYDWSTTDDDSDYLNSTTLDLCRSDSDEQSQSGTLGCVSSIGRGCTSRGREAGSNQSSGSVANSIPPPPFATPPKLQPVEQVMNNYSGCDVASLRTLTTALARDAIFGREELSRSSLSGRKNTDILSLVKQEYIKTLVK